MKIESDQVVLSKAQVLYIFKTIRNMWIKRGLRKNAKFIFAIEQAIVGIGVLDEEAVKEIFKFMFMFVDMMRYENFKNSKSKEATILSKIKSSWLDDPESMERTLFAHD